MHIDQYFASPEQLSVCFIAGFKYGLFLNPKTNYTYFEFAVSEDHLHQIRNSANA